MGLRIDIDANEYSTLLKRSEDYARLREENERLKNKVPFIEQYKRERHEAREYRSAFFKIGAEIAKAGCCDHAEGEDDNPNRCTREHLMVLFLAMRRELAGDRQEVE